MANDCFRRLRFDVAVERIDNHLKEMWGKKAKTVGLPCLVCLVKHLKKRYCIYIYNILYIIYNSIVNSQQHPSTHLYTMMPKHTMHFGLLVAKLELFPPSVNYIFSMLRRSHDRVDAWK